MSDSLGAGWSRVRTPLRAKGFYLPVPLQNGPGFHPASPDISTWAFRRVKLPGRGADHPPNLTTLRMSTPVIVLPLFASYAILRGDCTSVFKIIDYISLSGLYNLKPVAWREQIFKFKIVFCRSLC